MIPPTELSAFVLAGGQSSRMGRDKALLPYRGQTLLGRMLSIARDLTPQVSIVGSTAKYGQYGPVIEDAYAEHGPLAGIHAALSTSTTDLNIFLAVDLPHLDPGFLRRLVALASDRGTVVTVPRAEGRLQPLCAVYRKQFALSAEIALQQGNNKIDLVFEDIPVQICEPDMWRSWGFGPEIFLNLNTPADLDRPL